MALRSIDVVLQEKDAGEDRELLEKHKVLEHRQRWLPDGEVLGAHERQHEFSAEGVSLTAGLQVWSRLYWRPGKDGPHRHAFGG